MNHSPHPASHPAYGPASAGLPPAGPAPAGPAPARPTAASQVLRLLALTAVCIGLLVLAAAAFLLSYPGIHAVALQAGVSSSLARVYPVIFDAMLIIACAAVLSLRGAGALSRAYAWLALLVLVAAAAGGDALHSTGIKLPHRPAAAAAAIIPWALVLMGFGLLLAMLRHARLHRAAVAAQGGHGQQFTGIGQHGAPGQLNAPTQPLAVAQPPAPALPAPPVQAARTVQTAPSPVPPASPAPATLPGAKADDVIAPPEAPNVPAPRVQADATDGPQQSDAGPADG